MSGVSRDVLDSLFPHDKGIEEQCHSACIGGQAAWQLPSWRR
jgi:hypothetical protein